MPDALRNVSRSQIIGIVCFIILLLGIPIGLFAIKQTQSLNSSASAPTPVDTRILDLNNLDSSPSAKTEAVDDLKNGSAAVAQPSATPTPSASPTSAVSFGPTLNIKISIEGRPTGKNAAKMFVGIAKGTPTDKPTYLLSFTVDFPDSGKFEGLSLAGLETQTSYTAYVKGPAQIASASAFTLNPTVNALNNDQPLQLLTGDLNEDNAINTADLTIMRGLLGTTPTSQNWSERADFNLDNIINSADLAILYRNLNKTGDSGTWYSPPPPATSSASLNTGTGGYTATPSSRIMPIKTTGGYWLWVPQ